MTPLDALRWAWAGLTVLGLLGMAWHVRMVAAALRLRAWSHTRALAWDDREAVQGRVRNALYRLTVKALLTAFAATCWALFTGRGSGGGWGLVWLATGLFAAALGVLTAWAVHAYRAAGYRRRGPPVPPDREVPSRG